jgi:glucose/mannose-6-phosphate isomerase
MNLDDLDVFARIDSQNLLAQIEALPQRLEQAWALGQTLPLTLNGSGLSGIVIAAGSTPALAAEMLAAWAAPACALPIAVRREAHLPAWASGAGVLVIGLSGEQAAGETLAAFRQAGERGCRCLAICGGDDLPAGTEDAGVWRFETRGIDRYAAGEFYALLLRALSRLGLIPDPQHEVAEAAAALRTQQAQITADLPAAQNQAKRIAGQLVNRSTAVLAGGLLAPLARRWKNQINETAKAWAAWDSFPETAYNTLAGTMFPEKLMTQLCVLFLRAPSDSPLERQRSDLIRRSFMLEGLSTDPLDARGETRLAQQFTCLHLGDYISYYLAMAYGVDPAPSMVLDDLRRQLG